MNYEYMGLLGLVVAYFIREWVNKKQKRNLVDQVAKVRRALSKEKNKNAAIRSKKRSKDYHDLRDAYGRFSRKGNKSGNS